MCGGTGHSYLKLVEATQSLEKRRFWHNTPLVITLIGTITIAANALSSVILNNQSSSNAQRIATIEAQLSEQQKKSEASRQASKDERTFAFSIIEKELAKSSDMAARANVLLFLVRSGILNGLNRDELEKMALNDLKKTDADPSSVGIPETLGLGRPDYNLDLPPVNPGQTKAARLLLEAATREINRNVEEQASFDNVKKYWSAVPNVQIDQVTPDTAWSGAFLAWVIAASGNPDGIVLSTANDTVEPLADASLALGTSAAAHRSAPTVC